MLSTKHKRNKKTDETKNFNIQINENNIVKKIAEYMVNADYLKVSFNDPLMAYCIDLSNLSALLKRLLKDICIESELKKIVSENEHVREWKNIKLIFSEWVTEYINNQHMTIPLD